MSMAMKSSKSVPGRSLMIPILLAVPFVLISSGFWVSRLAACVSLCLVMLWAMKAPRSQSVAAGFLIGLWVDLESDCLTGTHAFSFAWMAWYVWEVRHLLLADRWPVQMILASGVTLACSFSVVLLSSLGGRPAPRFSALWTSAGPEALLNAILFPLLNLCGRRSEPLILVKE